jgi:hypothetical protein
MIQSIMFALVLSMAPAKADPVDNARKAFNNCMIEVHNKSVGEKMSVSAFRDAADTACTTEKSTYHDLIVKQELGYKSKPADAEQFAKEEVQAVIDYVTSAYSDNVEAGAKMTPEK